MDYWATPEADDKIKKHLGCASDEELFERLHIDRPVSVSPVYAGPPLLEDRDQYGCMFRDVRYGDGTYRECINHPLAAFDTVEEIDANYTWPIADWYDYSTIANQLTGKESRPVQAGGSEPLLLYKRLRGEEQAFMDLVLAPDIVAYCLDKLFDFCYENTSRIYEKIPGKTTFTYVSEDMGSEKDLMFSPELIRRFLMPRMKRMMDLVHQSGAYVFHHNDGAIRKILPDLVDAGIDILNPVQWNCFDMDRESLKSDFGKRVVFHGGMDNQYTLPFGSTKEVREEVLDNIRILGAGGGYILAPCHNIQVISPPENITALYDTGFQYGGVF